MKTITQPRILVLPLFTLLATIPAFAADSRLSERAGTNNVSQVREIIVVFKTHYDIGYTDLVTNILTKYRTTFADKALSVIDSSRSRRGVLVTLFGPDSYSDKTLLRVWEQAGKSGSLTVDLPADFSATKAVPVNLRGEPAGDVVKIRKDAFSFKLGAFAPASYRLE